MTAATAVASLELLAFDPQSLRADESLSALASAARAREIHVSSGHAYQGGSDLLVLWGPGHPARFEPMRRQVAAGGHVCALDLAYWHRPRKVRLSVDAAHPQAWVMKKTLSPARFAADGITVSDEWDPRGPVVIAGLGDKARVQYGAAEIDAWEDSMIAACEQRRRPFLYRPKRSATPIETALRGASLVITWHSNVAVDAIRMGLPVICRDGAAAAVCASTWTDDIRPLPAETRDRFLSNLAWFQWDLSTEASACLAFLQELLS